jgi:multiple sugar transport system permease protein
MFRDKFDLKGLLFVGPALIFLFAIIIYPLLTIFPQSFQEYSSELRSFVFVGFTQYQRLLSDELFWASIKTTLIFTIITVIFHLLVGWTIALLLNAKWPNFKVRNFFRGVLILPWIFSAPASALLWRLLYHSQGLLPYLTQQVFHTRINFLSDPKWAMLSVLLVNAWNFYPLYMMLILGGLQAIPQSLYEAAKVDGANRPQSFWHITLPQMSSLMMTIIIIDFISTFIHFDLVWTMTKGGPLRSTYLISFFLYERGLLTYKFGYASAVSVIIALIICVFLVGYIIVYARKEEVTS